ncbi:MAG: GtrA family protein [Bacteroidales bacterium]|nr:GtrA family protein [Bacteroidales bacterium]
MKFLQFVADGIEKLIHFFYLPFRKFIPEQTFKYAATGGANTTLDIILYFIFYNFVLEKQNFDIGIYVFSPHIAAFFLSFSITFPIGFFFAKFISFPGSYLKKRIQLLRYGMTVFISILINYVFLKFFVEYIGIYPTPSKMLTTVIAILFSYFSQKHFTFKMEKE